MTTEHNDIDKFIALLNSLYNSLGEEYLSIDRSNEFKRTTWTRIENFNNIVDKLKEIVPSLPNYKFKIPAEQDNEPNTLIHEILGYTKEIILFLKSDFNGLRDFDEEYKSQEEKKKQNNETITTSKRTALIKQLETEKKAKEGKANCYLQIAIISFSVIALLNISFFVIACIKGWELDFSEFIKKFLGRGIYILTIEAFIAFTRFLFSCNLQIIFKIDRNL